MLREVHILLRPLGKRQDCPYHIQHLFVLVDHLSLQEFFFFSFFLPEMQDINQVLKIEIASRKTKW